MARTDATTVKSIMQTALTDAQLTLIINQANRIVTDELADQSLSAQRMTDIETWLTAHLIAMGKERQPQSEKVGDIWLTYKNQTKEQLMSTTFGQMVLMLDTSGKLARISKGEVRIRAIKQIND